MGLGPENSVINDRFMSEIQFTGEFMVPGKCEERIESDHFKRYEFAAPFCHGKSVLDIACGYGYGSAIVARENPKTYLGVDINQQLIKHACSRYGSESIRFAEGSILDLRLVEKFEVALCFETIEHVEDYRQALHSLLSVITPGGILIISSPNRPVTSPSAKKIGDLPANPFHVQEFEDKEFMSILQDVGFLVDMSCAFGQRLSFRHSLPTPAKRVLSKLLGNPMYSSSPTPRRYKFRQPAYYLFVARKP